jgi:hypothetical protein
VVIVGVHILFLYPADVKLLNLPHKSMQFEFAAITQGTNHVIFVGAADVSGGGGSDRAFFPS